MPVALEYVSVVMGFVIVAHAYTTMAVVPLLVGAAIIAAHGNRIAHPDHSCYYWCGS